MFIKINDKYIVNLDNVEFIEKINHNQDVKINIFYGPDRNKQYTLFFGSYSDERDKAFDQIFKKLDSLQNSKIDGIK